MTIATELLASPLHIHVSVQLGEWPVGEDKSKPKTPTSDLWWNIDGWIANNLWANGMDTLTYETPEFKIKNVEIRELQICKERFGKGEWKMNTVKGQDGKFYSIDYPQGDSYHTIVVN